MAGANDVAKHFQPVLRRPFPAALPIMSAQAFCCSEATSMPILVSHARCMAPLLDCLRQNSLLLEQTAYSGILLDPFISIRYKGSSQCCCTGNRFSYIRATQALLDPTWENLRKCLSCIHLPVRLRKKWTKMCLPYCRYADAGNEQAWHPYIFRSLQ